MSLQIKPSTTIEDSVKISWLVPKEDKDDLLELLQDIGKVDSLEEKIYEPKDPEEIEASKFSPLELLIGAIAICHLADVIINLVKDVRHSGLIILAKKNDEIEISESTSLNRGEVLLVDKHGKGEEFHFNTLSRKEIISVIKDLIKKQ